MLLYRSVTITKVLVQEGWQEMIIITGGAYQGKQAVAKTVCKKENPVIAEGEKAGEKELEQADIITHFHLYIRHLLEKGIEPETQVQELLQKNPKVILEITQLGCGVVPMDAFDRNYREQVGRISCKIAESAEAVYLVNCGISKRLK